MKTIKKIPTKDIYIDGHLVISYTISATQEEINVLNRKINDDTNCGQKKVIQYNLDDIFVAEHSSVTEASRRTMADRASIARCANGRYKMCAGFKWKWK